MEFKVRTPRQGLPFAETVAWVRFPIEKRFSALVGEATVACERVRHVARMERQHEVYVSDAVFGGPRDAMVAVSAPAGDLDRWLARMVFALSTALGSGDVESVVVTVPGKRATRLEVPLEGLWAGFVSGALARDHADVAQFLDAGAVDEAMAEVLLGDEQAHVGEFRPRQWVSPALPGGQDMFRQLVRSGLPTQSSMLATFSIAEARAALSMLDALPFGYGVGSVGPWIIVDELGWPRAVIEWGDRLQFHRPRGSHEVGEYRLRNIGARRYDERLGHVVVEPAGDGGRPPRTVRPEHVELPLGPDDRLVMIDSSVMWSSAREGFPKDVVIMFHTALAMDIVMAEFAPEFDPWRSRTKAQPYFFDYGMTAQDLPGTPLAPSKQELGLAAELMGREFRAASAEGREPRLSRTDAISAALAATRKVPLLTRTPEIYSALKVGRGLVIETLEPATPTTDA